MLTREPNLGEPGARWKWRRAPFTPNSILILPTTIFSQVDRLIRAEIGEVPKLGTYCVVSAFNVVAL